MKNISGSIELWQHMDVSFQMVVHESILGEARYLWRCPFINKKGLLNVHFVIVVLIQSSDVDSETP